MKFITHEKVLNLDIKVIGPKGFLVRELKMKTVSLLQNYEFLIFFFKYLSFQELCKKKHIFYLI